MANDDGRLIVLPDWYFPDGQSPQSDVRIYLDGLITRNCEGPPPGTEHEPTPAQLQLQRELADDTRRMITMSEGGSIKYVAASREEIRRYTADGWTFDAETVAWAGD